MTTVPLLEIIFALILGLLPENTTEFTIGLASYSHHPVIFTRSGDSWAAKGTQGEDLGFWKLDGLIVTKRLDERKEQIDLKDWISYTNGQPSVRNKAVTITREEGKITLSDESKQYPLNSAEIRYK